MDDAVAGADVDAGVHRPPAVPEPGGDGARGGPDEPGVGHPAGAAAFDVLGVGLELPGPDEGGEGGFLPAEGVDLGGELGDAGVEGRLQPVLLVEGLLQLGQLVGRRLAPVLGQLPGLGQVGLVELLVLAGGPHLVEGVAVAVDHRGEQHLAPAGLTQVLGPDDLEQGVAPGVDVGLDGGLGHFLAEIAHPLLGGGQLGLGRALGRSRPTAAPAWPTRSGCSGRRRRRRGPARPTPARRRWP